MRETCASHSWLSPHAGVRRDRRAHPRPWHRHRRRDVHDIPNRLAAPPSGAGSGPHCRDVDSHADGSRDGAAGLRRLAELRSKSHSLRGVAGVVHFGASPRPFLDGDRTLVITYSLVTGNFFEVLGTKPVIGRLLRDADEAVGTPPMMVLSYSAWQSQFDGNPAVLGRTLVDAYDRSTVTIVGVAPPEDLTTHSVRRRGSRSQPRTLRKSLRSRASRPMRRLRLHVQSISPSLIACNRHGISRARTPRRSLMQYSETCNRSSPHWARLSCCSC